MNAGARGGGLGLPAPAGPRVARPPGSELSPLGRCRCRRCRRGRWECGGWRLDPRMGPLPGPVRGSDSLKFLPSPVIYKATHSNGCVTLGAAPAPPAASGTQRPRPPGTPERAAAAAAGRREPPRGDRSAPRAGVRRPLGVAEAGLTPPCPPPPGSPGIGSDRGRRDPAPGPPPLGWRLPGKGRGRPGLLPPPETRPRPAPCWRRWWLRVGPTWPRRLPERGPRSPGPQVRLAEKRPTPRPRLGRGPAPSPAP